ncbi:hypothetical protein WMY93_032319, partial [Mugilogobius chulae]
DYLKPGRQNSVHPVIFDGEPWKFFRQSKMQYVNVGKLSVTLVQSSESISVLKRLTEQNPDRIDFGSDFRSGSVKETTTCNVCLDPLKGPLCNYSDPSTGEQWFCYKPKTLDCDKRVNHFVGKTKTIISKEEEALFQTFKPAGYYFNNIWRPLSGPAVRQFNNASAITACLKGKQLHMFGDSTVRQYYSYITQSLKNLQTFDKHSSSQGGPFLAVNQTDDIMVTYRTHGVPIRIYPLPVSQVQYVSSELDRVKGGPNTVVIVGVWAHFGNYPMELYCQRLLNIRRAILHLFIRAPGTKVIIRTGNMKYMNLFISASNSDWYALQLDNCSALCSKTLEFFCWNHGKWSRLIIFLMTSTQDQRSSNSRWTKYCPSPVLRPDTDCWENH